MNPHTNDCYGSLTSEQLAEELAAVPFWVHVTAATDLPGVLRDGLKPRSLLEGDGRHPGVLAPRPGCVYLVAASLVGWAAEWAGLGGQEDAAVVAVDLAGIAPGRVLPDEDEWTEISGYANNPRDYGLPCFAEADYASSGVWADAVRLGAQPGTCLAAMRGGRIAVRGMLEPARVRHVGPVDGLPSGWAASLA